MLTVANKRCLSVTVSKGLRVRISASYTEAW